MSDYSTLPEGLEAPEDDGGAAHLTGMRLPDVSLPATDGRTIDLRELKGVTVIYAYPMTGRPGVALPPGWNDIPGARGCTPQSCSFRDHFAELKNLGVVAVFGLSTQTSDYQREAVERLHLPFAMLSDRSGDLAAALGLPTMEVAGERLLKRLTMVVREGTIEKVFYPVFPPDRNVVDVIDYLSQRG